MKKKKFSTKFRILKQEVEVTFYKSSGPGGQRKNKKETAVRIYHPPSDVTVTATEYRSQVRNRELAFKRLQERLKKLNKKEKKRIPTKMPGHVKEKILDEKKKQSQKKKRRKKPIIKEEELEE
jgi:protein subunit release factor B